MVIIISMLDSEEKNVFGFRTALKCNTALIKVYIVLLNASAKQYLLSKRFAVKIYALTFIKTRKA